MKNIKIVGQDISKFTVVLPEKPSLTEEKAASEFVSHIKTATGTELPIDKQPTSPGVYIGRASDRDRAGILYDGYAISVSDGDLHLFGACDRGSLYAVYRFLEKYIGFRKYEPGVGRLLPGDVDIAEDLHYASNPVFSDRFTNWASHVLDASYAAWSGITNYLPGVEAYGGYPLTAVGFCHTFDALCDSNIYFDEHPEYFSLWEGRRIPGGNAYDRPVGQLCLTNPAVLEIVIENVRKALQKNPNATIVEVSQNDNGRYCQCENCAAVDEEEGSPAGLMLRFVNAVASAIEDDYPDALVRTFAYQYTRKPPKITRPHKNVIIRYCTIEACFRHGLDDDGCKFNTGAFKEELLGWGKICDKISIWDYTRNFSAYFAPYPVFETIRGNAKFFADNNALHVFEQDTESATYTGDLGSLKAYLLARLLWNPYMSQEEYDAHTDDFLEGYYGSGWKNIREYMRILHDTTRHRHMNCFERMDIAGKGTDPLSEQYIPEAYQDIAEDTYLSKFIEDHLDESMALWDKALAKAKEAGQAERVRRSRLSMTYLDLFCRKHEKDKMSREEQEKYEAAVEDFFAEKERFGCHYNLWTARHGR